MTGPVWQADATGEAARTSLTTGNGPSSQQSTGRHSGTDRAETLVTIFSGNESDECVTDIPRYGALLALQHLSERFPPSVLAANANTDEIIGMSPQALFNLPSFLDILSSTHANEFVDHLQLTGPGNTPRI